MARTISRKEIAYAIRNEMGVTYDEAEEWVRFLIENIVESLERGEEVQLSGLGRFTVKERKARKGRDMVNGRELPLPPRYTVVFRMGPRLKELLNPLRKKPLRTA